MRKGKAKSWQMYSEESPSLERQSGHFPDQSRRLEQSLNQFPTIIQTKAITKHSLCQSPGIDPDAQRKCLQLLCLEHRDVQENYDQQD
jgi:hypothetical protein